jgi:SPP1 gp7 family putative phage head morphogenesis protein
MPSAVVAQIEQFRQQVARLDATQTARMAATWADATRGLQASYDQLAVAMADRAARGLPVSLWHIQRQERYQSLLRQIDVQERALAHQYADDITSAQRVLAQLGLAHSQETLDLMAPGIVGQFDRLAYDAVADMVGNTAGGPLHRLILNAWGSNAGAVANALTRGTALGWHPTKTARAMRDATNMNLTRAIVISRTESLRVYRQATLEQYRASGVVTGYVRIATHDTRTCVACLSLDRKVYRLDEDFAAHPNCRCALAAITRTSPPITSEDGREWFERQDATVQREMLGPQRFNLWRTGRVSFDDMTRIQHNATWGDSPQVVPVRELVS